MMRSKITSALLVFATAFVTPALAQKKQLGLALAGAQSAAYVLGGGLAELISKNSKVVNISAQTTKGFAANVRLVNSGSTELGFSAAPLFYEALRGTGEFNEKHPDIRAVHPIWPAELHCVAFKNTGIRKQSDLAGKRISLGLKTTSGAVITEILLREAGVWDKITPIYQNPTQSANGMRDGKVDVMCANTGGPYPAFIGLTGGGGLMLIPWQEETVRKAADAAPGRTPRTIKKGTYSWQTEDVPSVGHWSFMFANKDVSDEAIYDILRIWLSAKGREQLVKVGDGWKNIPDKPLADVLSRIGLPLHPGAVRYWKEQGVAVPAIKNAALD